MTAIAVPRLRARPTIGRGSWLVLLGAAFAVGYLVFRGQGLLPHDEGSQVFTALNELRDWISDNRTANPIFVVIIGTIRAVAGGLVDLSVGALLAMGWPAVVTLAGALGLAFGGRRLALLQVAGYLSLGVLGLWQPAMQTLGLTLAAVVLSLVIGIPIGIVAGRSSRVLRAISPVLDGMQIMPTFAYLAPMALFFSIGSASAAIATMIYAVPATIRITALGIRLVPAATVEAATSLGATRGQLLRKVQLPLAARALGLAVNQTIMLALSMVVVTVLIAAPGLGVNILHGLEVVDVGAAFDAGLAIVILAIVLDRLTDLASRRLDPRHLGTGSVGRIGRRGSIATIGVLVVLVAAAQVSAIAAEFPEALAFSFREPVNAVTNWIKTNLFEVTNAIKNGFTYGLLNPTEYILTTAPWSLVVGLTFGLAWIISGLRAAVTAVICLLLVAGLALWEHGMQTLTTVLAATAITLVLGGILGIWSARSDRASAIMRPFLDAAQTMPSFVYLIPAVALFQASRFTAIVAAVIFAVPPVIRLVEQGIRMVPPTIVEAAVSSGASRGQLLWKVQLPVARPALLLAANQGIVMVLGMVVVGGLVGAGALGYDVVAGFAQRTDFGEGLAAGIAIVSLGIMLDRITQGAGVRPATRVGKAAA